MRIIGRTIRLRDIEKADMASKVKWFNDPEVNKTLLIDEPLDLARTLDWFEKHSSDDSRRDFVVESKEGDPIGITGLVHINKTHGTAECYCVIGEKAFWGKGLGTEVHRLLIDWGFRELGLHKIWADIRGENTAIIRVIEKLGFKVEGTLREEKYIGGKRIDAIRIGLLRDEFYEANPHLARPPVSG
jgi:RimJ/RimL family protein N-acetyltransferase